VTFRNYSPLYICWFGQAWQTHLKDQVVNGILDGALAGKPGLHGKAQDCQQAQSAIAHLHPCQRVNCKQKTPTAIAASASLCMT
jgi:hypothetical protein